MMRAVLPFSSLHFSCSRLLLAGVLSGLLALSPVIAQERIPPQEGIVPQVGPPREGRRENGGRPPGLSRQVLIEQRRAIFEARLRGILGGNGVTQPEMQDAVIGYLAREEAAKAGLREAARRLGDAVRRRADDETLRPLRDDYLKMLESDKARRAEAEKKLDEQISFSKNLRLEVLLRLAGVLGDGAPQFNINNLPVANPSSRYEFAARTETPNMPASNALADAGNIASYRALGVATPNGPTEGIARGQIQNKDGGPRGVFWIEIRPQGAAENAPLERYMPIYKPELRGFEPRTLALLKNVVIGDWVEIEWFWNEHRRIVTLKPFQPANYALGQPATPQTPPTQAK